VVQLGIVFLVASMGVLLLRNRFVLESFEVLGNYRAAAVDVIAARDINYAGCQVVRRHSGRGKWAKN
jgi:hypothetical protein